MRPRPYSLACLLVVSTLGCGRIGYAHTASDAGLDGPINEDLDTFARQ